MSFTSINTGRSAAETPRSTSRGNLDLIVSCRTAGDYHVVRHVYRRILEQPNSIAISDFLRIGLRIEHGTFDVAIIQEIDDIEDLRITYVRYVFLERESQDQRLGDVLLAGHYCRGGRQRARRRIGPSTHSPVSQPVLPARGGPPAWPQR